MDYVFVEHSMRLTLGAQISGLSAADSDPVIGVASLRDILPLIWQEYQCHGASRGDDDNHPQIVRSFLFSTDPGRCPLLPFRSQPIRTSEASGFPSGPTSSLLSHTLYEVSRSGLALPTPSLLRYDIGVSQR